MKRTTTLATVTAGVLATVTLFSATNHAADEPAAAQNVQTVWLDGKGETSFAEKANKMHVVMEAKGWKFGDIEIYTEDGDMKGAFVTYVR